MSRGRSTQWRTVTACSGPRYDKSLTVTSAGLPRCNIGRAAASSAISELVEQAGVGIVGWRGEKTSLKEPEGTRAQTSIAARSSHMFALLATTAVTRGRIPVSPPQSK